jgi:predicted neuraminidase
LLFATILISFIDYWNAPSAFSPARGKWLASSFQSSFHPEKIHWKLESQGSIPTPNGMPISHASHLLAMPANHPAAVTVFWFAGERESAPNVEIAASQYQRSTQTWSPAHLVLNRLTLGEQLGWGIRRLGNPVAWLDKQGRMHLFVVATGLGGWAASRILHLRQSSVSNINSTSNTLGTLHFEPVRVLPLSWLWNTSFLVRNAPLPLEDGGMMLPVHFELGFKYPAAVRFDADGNFIGMVRISQRKYLLQPSLVMRSDTEWIALMRDNHQPGKIGVARSTDAGAHWHDQPPLVLDNPDAAVAGLSLTPDYMVLLHNSSIGSRTILDWSASHNGQDWQLVHNLARGVKGNEFSYPSVVWNDSDQQLWVSFTMNRQHIAWQRFTPR